MIFKIIYEYLAPFSSKAIFFWKVDFHCFVLINEECNINIYKCYLTQAREKPGRFKNYNNCDIK